MVLVVSLLAACGGQADPSLTGETDSVSLEVEDSLGDEQVATACVLLAGDGPDGRFAREDESLLASAFEDAGIDHKIVNAKGDVDRFNSLANELIGSSCFVLFMASPDSAAGVAVIAKAQERGIPVVDYENLTLGGGADYYLGFDLVSVGVTQGLALIDCFPPRIRKPKIVYLNGSPTDANATLLKFGYAGVLEGGEGKKAGVVVVDDQSVPDWVDAKVADIIKLIWARADNKVDGLVAASDSLAIAAIESLPSQGENLQVVGQGATVSGLQSLIDGTLCATVYKPVSDLASGASEIASAILREGFYETPDTLTDIATGVAIPAKLILARKVGPAQVPELLLDGFISVAEICDAKREAACQELGIT